MKKEKKEMHKNWGKIKEESEAMEKRDEYIEEDEELDESLKKEEALDYPSHDDLEEKLTQAEQKAHENWEKAVRAMAELENIRQRSEREISKAHRYGAEKLLTSFLPVADSLEQALQLSTNDTQMQEGLTLTLKLFLDVLEKNGVIQLNPEGETFNPQEHEAMTMQESEEAAPNTVIAVFQKGYRLYDRVIRPARVVVAKAKT